jgi:hypothetical protein
MRRLTGWLLALPGENSTMEEHVVRLNSYRKRKAASRPVAAGPLTGSQRRRICQDSS